MRTLALSRLFTRGNLFFFLGLLLFVVVLVIPSPPGMTTEARYVAATVLLTVCWWIGESLPLGATALIPVAAFPMLRVMPIRQITSVYANEFVFLLLGGFFIALAMERWNLHKRIALWIISLVGTSSRRLVLGCMISTAFLSMWISNSATTMMMMPIGLGIITKIEELGSNTRTSMGNFGPCLMLGVAYAANIGGVGTLVGTFPNLVLAGQLKELFPLSPELTFTDWLKVGLPFVIFFVPITWFYLVAVATPVRGTIVENADVLIKKEIERLGPMSKPEKKVLMVFATTACLWVFRRQIDLGVVSIPGWADLLGLEKYVHDSTVAVAMSLVCFALPANTGSKTKLLEWEDALRAPWGILLLFGGGFAIAAGFAKSGLINWVGTQLEVIKGIPLIMAVGTATLVTVFLTEVTSNTATATMVIPILASISKVLAVNPLVLMFPAAISASCAFMLPISTPPNAIVFGTGRIQMVQMVRVGFFLNLVSVIFITTFTFLVIGPAMGISIRQVPSWAG